MHLLIATFLAGSILTLALPLGVLIVVAIWYVLLWRAGTGEH
jgi:cytochrome b